jgi:hypothetical protein
MNMSQEIFTYRIDKSDIILSVSPNWDSFARANGCIDECCSEKVVGHRLWEFIQGIQIRHFYELLFEKVRKGTPVRPIPFRCDSPWERRFLQLSIMPLPDGQIEMTSSIVKTQSRAAVTMLDKDTARSNDFIRICSMCKKIATPHDYWLEIEEGLAQLKLFEADEMPQLTHGLCPDCFRLAMSELND